MLTSRAAPLRQKQQSDALPFQQRPAKLSQGEAVVWYGIESRHHVPQSARYLFEACKVTRQSAAPQQSTMRGLSPKEVALVHCYRLLAESRYRLHGRTGLLVNADGCFECSAIPLPL